MKHVVNILLLGMVLLGTAMMTDTLWGGAVALVPFVVWGWRFLLVVHRSVWASILFWAGIAYFSWQVALLFLVIFLVVRMVKAIRKEGGSEQVQKHRRGRNHRAKQDDLHLYLDSRSAGGLGIGTIGDD